MRVRLATVLFLFISTAQAATAFFSSGCFWCTQSDFDKLSGVTKTIVGYMGGTKPNPTYKIVTSGKTKYAEATKITYDPEKVSYSTLLQYFWHSVDPTDAGGQFCDRGEQYRGEIFYTNAQQKIAAEKSKEALKKSRVIKQPIVTKITKAGRFYPAEAYHQKFYQKNPIRYKYYRYNCGRDRRLEKLWGNLAGKP